MEIKEDDFIPIDSGFDTLVGFAIEYDKRDELVKQILGNQAKLEKITAFAKNLVSSNPHISWQLKQLLLDTPTKQADQK